MMTFNISRTRQRIQGNQGWMVLLMVITLAWSCTDVVKRAQALIVKAPERCGGSHMTVMHASALFGPSPSDASVLDVQIYALQPQKSDKQSLPNNGLTLEPADESVDDDDSGKRDPSAADGEALVDNGLGLFAGVSGNTAVTKAHKAQNNDHDNGPLSIEDVEALFPDAIVRTHRLAHLSFQKVSHETQIKERQQQQHHHHHQNLYRKDHEGDQQQEKQQQGRDVRRDSGDPDLWINWGRGSLNYWHGSFQKSRISQQNSPFFHANLLARKLRSFLSPWAVAVASSSENHDTTDNIDKNPGASIIASTTHSTTESVASSLWSRPYSAELHLTHISLFQRLQHLISTFARTRLPSYDRPSSKKTWTESSPATPNSFMDDLSVKSPSSIIQDDKMDVQKRTQDTLTSSTSSAEEHVVTVELSDGCSISDIDILKDENFHPLEKNSKSLLKGKIAVVSRGRCEFAQKVLNLQKLGAEGVIVVNYESERNHLANMKLNNSKKSKTMLKQFTIPAVMITYKDWTVMAPCRNENEYNMTASFTAEGEATFDIDYGRDALNWAMMRGMALWILFQCGVNVVRYKRRHSELHARAEAINAMPVFSYNRPSSSAPIPGDDNQRSSVGDDSGGGTGRGDRETRTESAPDTTGLHLDDTTTSTVPLLGQQESKAGSNSQRPVSTGDSSIIDPSDEPLCAICLDEFAQGDMARKLGCSHLYHKDCIDPWLQQSSSCPVCKRDIPNLPPPPQSGFQYASLGV